MPIIDVLDTGAAVGDQPERLFEQGPREAVHDEAVDLPFRHDRRVAGRAQERGRALDDAGGRPWGAGTTSTAGMR
jgi:hypothetical protein